MLYAVGDRLWKDATDTGDRVLVPVRLELPRRQAPPLLLRSARYLDLEAGAFSEPTDILMEAGRIRRIGTEALPTAESDVEVVDAAGRFAIPGLFDMHSHRALQVGNRYLCGGVTSVRSPGNYLVEILTLLDHAETSAAPTPRYFSSFEILEGIRADLWDSWLRIGTEEEGRSHVRLWKRLGARFVKLYRTVPWPHQRVIFEQQALRGAWLDELQSVQDAYDLGVNLQTGTDNDVGGMPLLHGEMEHFVAAGIPPLQVLRLATLAAAEAVGAEAHLGTLELGKLADLVLLEASPLDDIKNTQTIWRVIKGGWVFNPEELWPKTGPH